MFTGIRVFLKVMFVKKTDFYIKFFKARGHYIRVRYHSDKNSRIIGMFNLFQK